jgi:site-specific DNA-methyltransferase (adenine-specific)
MLELNHLYNLDCMEGMKDFPDKFFDLAIVDPPYGIGDFNIKTRLRNGKRIKTNSLPVYWNEKIPHNEYFNELKRISKQRIIWGANYYNCFENGKGALIWHKGSIQSLFSQCEIASLSFQQKVDYVHIQWQSGFVRNSYDYINGFLKTMPNPTLKSLTPMQGVVLQSLPLQILVVSGSHLR